MLLVICESLNIPITAFFKDNAFKATALLDRTALAIKADQMANFRRSQTKVSWVLDQASREQPLPFAPLSVEALKSSLNEAVAPTLSELKARIGPTEFLRIKHRLPELYRQLLDRHKARDADRILGVRLQVEKILNESPFPKSVGQVEKRLGLSQGSLSKLLPEICTELRERCLACRREAIALRQEELVEEVHSIVGLLHFQNREANVRLVRSLLRPDVTRNKVILANALKAAKAALSDQRRQNRA